MNLVDIAVPFEPFEPLGHVRGEGVAVVAGGFVAAGLLRNMIGILCVGLHCCGGPGHAASKSTFTKKRKS